MSATSKRSFFVNGVNSTDGGGASILRNFLMTASRRVTDDFFTVVVGREFASENLSPNIHLLRMSPLLCNAAAYPFLYRYVLPRMAKESKATAILNFGDVPINSRIHQVMLVDTPYAVYPDSPARARMTTFEKIKSGVKIALLRRGLSDVDVVVTQTPVMRDRVKAQYTVNSIAIIPNAVPLDHLSGGVPRNFHLPARVNFLCLSRYYAHKNIEILHDVALLAREQRLPVSLITTIGREQHPAAARFLDRIVNAKLDDIVLNIGPVPMPEIPSLYAQVQALLMPTLLESFTGTYLEAMSQRIPILTSDLDFARVCCGEAAFYFDPLDPSDIIRAMKVVMEDAQAVEAKVALAARIVEANPTWEESFDNFINLLSGSNTHCAPER